MDFDGRLGGREIASRAPRIDTGFVVRVRCAAGTFPARVTNLSSCGFRLRCSKFLEPGLEVSLEVPRRAPVKGLIRWAKDKEAGGVFLEAVAL
jgi:hypothetical protein